MSATVVRVAYRVTDALRADVAPELVERFLCDAAAARLTGEGYTVTETSIHGVTWRRLPADTPHDAPASWLAKVTVTVEVPA